MIEVSDLATHGDMAFLSEHVTRAREIVVRHGWNSTSYQILNPGIELWFSSDKRAVLGYSRRGTVLVAAGSPVCASEALASVCDEFETFARGEGYGVCYVCAEDRIEPYWRNRPATFPLHWERSRSGTRLSGRM